MEDQAYYELQDTNMDIPSTRNPCYNVAQLKKTATHGKVKSPAVPLKPQGLNKKAQKATTYYNRPGTESEMPIMQDNPSYTTCLESTTLESRTASTVDNNYDNCTVKKDTILPSYDNTKTAIVTATSKPFYDNPELRTKPATSGTSKPFYDDPELQATTDKPAYKTASSVKTSASLESDAEIQAKKATSNCRCYSWVIMLFVTVTIAISCTSMCICIWNVYRIKRLMNQEPLIIAAAIENNTTTTTTPIPILECGSESWTPVIRLDMSNSSQQCPDGWMEYDSPRRSCGRPIGTLAGCDQITLPVDTPYSRVCGRAIASSIAIPDAFATFGPRGAENYVDGISVTHSTPREHIWTFAADQTVFFRCPCNGIPQIPFVGENYFCDASGNGALWDGDCTIGLGCCTFNSPPWFIAQLPGETVEDIDVRICGDEDVRNENVHVEIFELYVQ